MTWWASPIDALAAAQTDRGMLSRMAPVVFGARGIVPIGYAAFALALGVAVGMLLKRTVAAMAVTLVALAAVLLLVPTFVRPHLLPPQTETVAITGENITNITGDANGVREIGVRNPPGAWVLTNETVDPAGNLAVPLPDFVRNCLPGPGGPIPDTRQRPGVHGAAGRARLPAAPDLPAGFAVLAAAVARTRALPRDDRPAHLVLLPSRPPPVLTPVPGGIMRTLAVATALTLTLSVSPVAAAATTPHLPRPTGHEPVGVSTLSLVDGSRPDPWVPTVPYGS